MTMMIIITLIKNSKYLILIKQIRSSFSVTFVIYHKRNQFLCLLYYYYYYYYYHCCIIIIIIIIIIISSMNIILLHYYLRAGILVKDTAIINSWQGVVHPLRREFYVAASSPKLRCRPVGDVNFKRFAITSNRSGK